jgi:hypothetical protein
MHDAVAQPLAIPEMRRGFCELGVIMIDLVIDVASLSWAHIDIDTAQS